MPGAMGLRSRQGGVRLFALSILALCCAPVQGKPFLPTVPFAYESLITGGLAHAAIAADREMFEVPAYVRDYRFGGRWRTFARFDEPTKWVDLIISDLSEAIVVRSRVQAVLLRGSELAAPFDAHSAAVGLLEVVADRGATFLPTMRWRLERSALVDLVRTKVSANVEKSVLPFGLSELHIAVAIRDGECVERLLHSGRLVEDADNFGMVPLQVAALNGWSAGVERLLAAGASPLGSSSQHGKGERIFSAEPWRWPSTLASASGHGALAWHLIQAIQGLRTKDGDAPISKVLEWALRAAVQNRQEATFELLLAHSREAGGRPRLDEVLEAALFVRSERALAALAAMGVTPAMLGPQRLADGLGTAAANGCVDAVESFLNAGAPVDGLGEGDSPLAQAAGMGQLDCVKRLLLAGAKPGRAGPGGPPLWQAIAYSALFKPPVHNDAAHRAVVECLLRAGASAAPYDCSTSTETWVPQFPTWVPETLRASVYVRNSPLVAAVTFGTPEMAELVLSAKVTTVPLDVRSVLGRLADARDNGRVSRAVDRLLAGTSIGGKCRSPSGQGDT